MNKFEKPELTSVEFSVAARLDGSNDVNGVGLHDSGAHSACTVKSNSKTIGYEGFCGGGNRNSSGGSGIGTC